MQRYRFFAVVGACLYLSGCVSTANVTVNYSPDPARKSPLETLKPLAVSISAEDHRESLERDRVGNRKNGFGGIMAPVQANDAPTALVREALKKEFENNGIQVVDAAAAGKVITAKVRKYWVENKMNVFDITMASIISADIVVEDSVAKGKTSSHTITGTAQDSRQIAGESAFEVVLNAAMAEFIQNFSRDPGLLSSLRRAAP